MQNEYISEYVPAHAVSAMPSLSLCALAGRYVEVPYHNATHAADVLSRTVALMKTEHLLQDDTLGSKCYMLACVMAAAIHDYGHPGLDNKFQIASDTEISRRFNQKTVLENYSIFQCLEMLRQRPMDAFDGSKVRKENLISLVIDMVRRAPTPPSAPLELKQLSVRACYIRLVARHKAQSLI